MDDSDGYHPRATATLRRLSMDRIRLLTTEHVRVETLNYLIRTGGLGHRIARRFGEWLRSPTAAVAVLIADQAADQRAWEIFIRYDRSGFTYTDCTSFAAMQQRGLSTAFAFDEHFAQMGFELLEG